jgi:hypothetical protein
LNEVTKDAFKSTLIKRDKKHSKSRAILEIYELVNVVSTETMRDIFETMSEQNELPFEEKYTLIHDKAERFDKIRLYANKQLIQLSALYSQTVGVIRPDFYTDNIKVNKKEVKFYLDHPQLIGE